MIITSDRMKPFIDLAGVLVTHLSPFCRDFDTPKDLLQAYIAYFPRTFKYGTISGTNEEFGEVEDSVDVTQMENFIAAVIRQLAKDIDELDNEGVTDATAVDDPIIEGSEESNPPVSRDTQTDYVYHKVMDAVIALLDCDDISNIFQLALAVSAATKSLNRKAER